MAARGGHNWTSLEESYILIAREVLEYPVAYIAETIRRSKLSVECRLDRIYNSVTMEVFSKDPYDFCRAFQSHIDHSVVEWLSEQECKELKYNTDFKGILDNKSTVFKGQEDRTVAPESHMADVMSYIIHMQENGKVSLNSKGFTFREKDMKNDIKVEENITLVNGVAFYKISVDEYIKMIQDLLAKIDVMQGLSAQTGSYHLEEKVLEMETTVEVLTECLDKVGGQS